MKKLFILFLSVFVLTNTINAQSESLHEELKKTFKKPYLSLGFLLQALAEYQGDTPGGRNSFYVGTFRFIVGGKLDGGFSYFTQAELTRNPAPVMLDMRLSYDLGKGFGIDGGLMKPSFGYEFLTSTQDLEYYNISQATANIASPRQIGFQGRFTNNDKTFKVSAGVFNGNGPVNGNNDNEFMYFSRVEAKPKLSGENSKLVVGANIGLGKDKNQNLLGGAVPGFTGDRMIYGGDFHLTLNKLMLSAEALFMNLKPTVGIDREALGFHASVGYFVSDKAQLLYRYDSFKDDKNLTEWNTNHIFGLNFLATSTFVFQANYVINNQLSEFKYHHFLINNQIYF